MFEWVLSSRNRWMEASFLVGRERRQNTVPFRMWSIPPVQRRHKLFWSVKPSPFPSSVPYHSQWGELKPNLCYRYNMAVSAIWLIQYPKGEGCTSASSLLVCYHSHLQSVVRCLWHHKLNQIVVGCVDGKAKIIFSPKTLVDPSSECV